MVSLLATLPTATKGIVPSETRRMDHRGKSSLARHRSMGRPKGYSREDVLLKAIGVFWQKGLADTSLQDLESVTGVNRSGLYAEFSGKEEMYLECLRHYLATRGGKELLSKKPFGWGNIEQYLLIGETCYSGRRGCFAVNSMREAAMLPSEALRIVADHMAMLRKLVIRNIRAEVPGSHDAEQMADTIFTFFSGLCVEQNVQPSPAVSKRRVAQFMRYLKTAP
jgi:TetR/AcrR family transcriptional regulator, copper-responsive repressor